MTLFLLLACAGDTVDPTTTGPSLDDTATVGEPRWETDLSDLSADQLDGALSAGLARCPLFAGFAFVYSDMDAVITELSPQPCPAVGVAGTMVRFTGGCTAPNSYTYGGVFEADNAGSLFAPYQDTLDTTLTFLDYYLEDTWSSWSFDGSWTLPPEGSDTQAPEEVALSCNLGRSTFGTFGALDCTAGEYGRECELLEGTEGEVDGVGRFGLSGSFASTETGYDGWLQLDGLQTLVFQLSDAANGCVPYTLDGEPREYCEG